jgi:hypothetical protein
MTDMTVKEAYRILQANCNFIESEIVHVYGPYPSYESGWENSWTYGMGHDFEATLDEVCKSDFGILVEDNIYSYPFFAIQPGEDWGYDNRPEIREAFSVLSEAYPFDIGDRVVIFRLPKNYEYGWGDEYIPNSFDNYLGKTLTVTGYDFETGNYYFDESEYGIPFFCFCSEEQYKDFEGDEID